jgi:hypothetical protein
MGARTRVGHSSGRQGTTPLRDAHDLHYIAGMSILCGTVEGAEIIGLTPTGRATVVALNMNDPLIVGAHALWVGFGAHPPPHQSSSWQDIPRTHPEG